MTFLSLRVGIFSTFFNLVAAGLDIDSPHTYSQAPFGIWYTQNSIIYRQLWAGFDPDVSSAFQWIRHETLSIRFGTGKRIRPCASTSCPLINLVTRTAKSSPRTQAKEHFFEYRIYSSDARATTPAIIIVQAYHVGLHR
jgi:hypothetical protein